MVGASAGGDPVIGVAVGGASMAGVSVGVPVVGVAAGGVVGAKLISLNTNTMHPLPSPFLAGTLAVSGGHDAANLHRHRVLIHKCY